MRELINHLRYILIGLGILGSIGLLAVFFPTVMLVIAFVAMGLMACWLVGLAVSFPSGW